MPHLYPFICQWKLSEVSQTEKDISYDVTHMWNLILKNYINELIYKTETDSQILKTNLWLPKGERGSEG